MQSDSSVDAPADAVRYAKNLFRTRAAEKAPSMIEQIVASLRVDLAPNRAAFGERSVGSAARQMLFEAGENAVDLRIAAGQKGLDVRGQVLGTGFETGEIVFVAGDYSRKGSIDNAQFEILALPAGEYSLTLRGISAQILIEKISLQ
ncbi:MAG: hypothetical protein AB7J13_03265 [Pyrinomonadaceae bacterium]